MSQIYENTEIVLVDDGSPEQSPTIIDKFAETDQRVYVIHQKNKGVAAARSAGLSRASGEYAIFVDGDDWGDSDYVPYFLALIKEMGFMIGMNKNNASTAELKTSEKISCKGRKDNRMDIWIYLNEILVAVWNKTYNRRSLANNNISTDQNIWYGEDMLFNIECLQSVDTVTIGEKSVYPQMYNPDSAMQKFNLQGNLCGIKSLEIRRSIWKKDPPAIERSWIYHRYCFNRSIASGLLESGIVLEYQDLYKECIRNIQKGIIILLRREKTPKAKVGWLLLFASLPLMAKHSISLRKILLRESLVGGKTLVFFKIHVFMCTPVLVQAIGGCA